MDTSSKKPAYGSRFLPCVVDDVAKSNPERVFAYVAKAVDISEGFAAVTFSAIAKSTDKLTTWVLSTIGRSDDFETIAYMGVPDLRYAVVFLAAVKCGYKLLLTSIRNSPSMNVSLLRQTNCSKFLFSSEIKGSIDKLCEEYTELQTFQVMPFLDLLVDDASRHIPFVKEWETSKMDPILVLHSSGSTGPPKPVIMNHATFAVADRDRYLPTPQGRRNQNWALWNFNGGGCFYSPFPAFHLAGFSSLLPLPIYSTSATLVIGPPTLPPTGHLVTDIMQKIALKAIFCPPIIAEQLVKEPNGIKLASNLDFLLYAGGPLSQPTGEALSAVTDVCQFYGQTETGPLQALVPKREDWAYLEWHPSQNCSMVPAVDGSYEMVLKPKHATMCYLAYNFPDVDEWHTGDLFKPHPTKPNLWTFYGRSDDIIVLSNGEKFNPVPMEVMIQSHSMVDAAIVVGQGHSQAALLLQSSTGSDSSKLIDAIWPLVEQANDNAPGHARLVRSKVLIALPERPFDKAAKGTVIRKSTERGYENEINKLYIQETLTPTPIQELQGEENIIKVQDWVRSIIKMCFKTSEFSDDDDFFRLGIDSLQISELCSALRTGIAAKHRNAEVDWISTRLIYTNPTMNLLASTIFRTLQHEDEISSSNKRSRVNDMDALVSEWTNNLERVPFQPEKIAQRSTSLRIAVTGSTGSLGSHLLKQLVEDERIDKVICLDRTTDARSRHEEIMNSQRRHFDIPANKVDFWKCDYESSDSPGLSGEQIRELREEVDIIIHNAWKVDFNHTLQSFNNTHLRGVRQLIDIALEGGIDTRIIFISSVSAVGRWREVLVENTVGEIIAPTCSVAEAMGYAESKQVAEQMLAYANSKSKLPVIIVRVGQIAGPVGQGKWNENEWFPSLIKTSMALGKIPDQLPEVDWIPVDRLAAIVDDLVHHDSRPNIEVFNLVNPKFIDWKSLSPDVATRIGHNVNLVSLKEWIESLKLVDALRDENLQKYPALKILDFFQNLLQKQGTLRFAQDKILEASETLRNLAPIDARMIEHWIEGWEI